MFDKNLGNHVVPGTVLPEPALSGAQFALDGNKEVGSGGNKQFAPDGNKNACSHKRYWLFLALLVTSCSTIKLHDQIPEIDEPNCNTILTNY